MSDTIKSLRSLLKGSTVVFAGVTLELVISFFAQILIARTLGPINYGAVTIGVTIMTVTSLLTVLGLGSAIGRFVPRYDDPSEKRSILVSAFQLSLPVTIAISLGIIFASDLLAQYVFHDPTVGPVISIFGITIPMVVFLKLTVSSLQGYKMTVPKVVLENILLPVSRFGFAAFVLLIGLQAVGIAWAYAAAYAIVTALGLFYLYRHTSLFSTKYATFSKHRELVRFSLPLLISSAMYAVFNDIDSLMLGYFSETGAVGIYSTVYSVGMLLRLGLISFSFLFVPLVSDLHSDRKYSEMKRIYQLITKWIFLATFPVFLLFIFFPGTALQMTYGDEYVSGRFALLVLSIGFFVHSTAGLNINTLTIINETRLIMYNNIAVAFLNIVLNILLIPQYSLLGAAIATTASLIALNAIASAELYWKTGIHPFTPSLVCPGAIAIILAGGFYWVSTYVTATPIMAVGFLISFGLIYLLVIILFGGIDQEEFTLLLQFEEHFGVNLRPIRTIIERFVK